MTTYRPPESTPLDPPPLMPLAEGEWEAASWPSDGTQPAPPTDEADELDTKPRRRWLRRLRPQSLTSRIVTGVVALVVILVLAIGATTYIELRRFLDSRLDQQLQSTAGATNGATVSRYFGQMGNGGGGQYALHLPQDLWIIALSPDATVAVAPTTTSGGAIHAMSLSAAQRQELVKRTSQSPLALTTTDGQALEVTVRPIVLVDQSTGDQTQGVAVVGLSPEETGRTLHRLVLLEWLIGGAAVLLAFAATAGGVELSLRRLRRVTVTAHEVAAELSPSGAGLERRVPVDEDDRTEVGQLADSMNTLLSAVETQFAARIESEQRMRQFLADASHELRTPLTSIRGYAELARMQRNAAGPASAESDDPGNLDRIESEGTRMSRLIDDLLMLARSDQAAERAEPARQYIEVDELLDDVVSGARAAYPTRQIDLTVATGLVLIGDADQLHRAVRNLVNNAAVHTRPDGPIGVRAVANGPDIVIQVADSGPGLNPEDAAHVFERFWRADKARTRARGGSGLGMSIVSSIVHAHGGAVRFDSSVETGSTVTIQVPSGVG